ncbi:hypothetical protein [Desulfonatronovibrio magnus]|uniref:hypothetical protein n=1 Tax=Desulfonatronovibrio magnus TaxID=698827 RepID=UPI0012F7BA27|nr:hypothetical protein [Desulfonatronovibrio magnus]
MHKEHDLRNKYITDGEKVIKERFSKIALYQISNDSMNISKKILKYIVKSLSGFKK